MPIYKYKFCDGTESNVEVSKAEYSLLKDFDKSERENNRRHRRRSIPLSRYVKEEEKVDKERDEDFKGVNE